jgi:alpha-galactosidase
MPFRFAKLSSGLQCWKKELLGGAVAVACVNMYGDTKNLDAKSQTNDMDVRFEFRDVGFAPDTLVRVRDLFEQKDLGVFSGSFTTTSIPLHGVQMLRLDYESKYKAEL